MKVFKFNGTESELSTQLMTSPNQVKIVSLSDNTERNLSSMLVRLKDIVVKGDGFVRNYHLLYATRNKKGQSKMEYIYE